MTNNSALAEVQGTALEQIDDQSIVDLMTGQAIEDYVYSFKQGGRVVEGLTLAGINEAANRRGGIHIEEVNHQETDTSWIATAKAVDEITNSSRFGAYEQPKMSGGRPDPFAFTKAIHKAQRNAIKQLLPVPIIREVLTHYLHAGKPPKNGTAGAGKLPPPTTPAEQASAPPQETARAAPNHRQEAVDAWNELETRLLNDHDINKFTFWAGVMVKFRVESREDLTEENWEAIANGLREDGFASWIRELTNPNAKVQCLAKFREREKDLPKDFWEQEFKKADAKSHATMSATDYEAALASMNELLGEKPAEDAEAEIPY